MPSLHYYLTPFAPGSKDGESSTQYVARPARSGSLNDQQLARLIAERCTLTEADVHATLIELRQHILRTVAEGGRVNLQGLVEFYPKLKGTFDDVNERRDPQKHKLHIGARPCKSLNKELARQRISWKRVAGPEESPRLHQLRDTRSGENNAVLSLGGAAGLTGARLKFNESRPDEGVFLIPVRQPSDHSQAGRSSKRRAAPADKPKAGAFGKLGTGPVEIRVNDYFGVRQKEIWFLVPHDLPTGAYELELRTRSRGGVQLLRERFPHCLAVQDPRAATQAPQQDSAEPAEAGIPA